MDYLIAILAGAVFGLVVSALKHRLIWRPYAVGKKDNLYARLLWSSLTNAGVLLLILLLRHRWPYSFYTTILAAAMGLSGGGKLFSAGLKRQMLDNI